MPYCHYTPAKEPVVFCLESRNRKSHLYIFADLTLMMLRFDGPGPARKASIWCVYILDKCHQRILLHCVPAAREPGGAAAAAQQA